MILPKPVEERSKGGIILPDDTKEREQFAQLEGTIIAKSPLAFTYASKDDWAAVNAEPPPVGSQVLFAKYGGVLVKGRDGKDYRLVNDKDICAVLS